MAIRRLTLNAACFLACLFGSAWLVWPLAASAQQTTQATDLLQSPWSEVPVKRSSSQGKELPCAELPVLGQSVGSQGYYSDKASSVIDAERQQAYQRVVAPWHAAARALASHADRYRALGQASDAQCVAQGLAQLAKKQVLTGPALSQQDGYVQGWMLGAWAIAWLKVNAEPSLPDLQRQHIDTWLGQLADQSRQPYDQHPTSGSSRNNHRYWAGLAVMAAGIAVQRQDLYDWGLRSYETGVAQVTAQDMLPLELARRSRALHYHLFAAAPLVAMAELADANGLNLYRAHDAALPRLVRRTLLGVRDPQIFAEAAGVVQEPVSLSAPELAWAIPFEKRFPDTELAQLLARLPSRSVLYLGGLPPP